MGIGDFISDAVGNLFGGQPAGTKKNVTTFSQIEVDGAAQGLIESARKAGREPLNMGTARAQIIKSILDSGNQVETETGRSNRAISDIPRDQRREGESFSQAKLREFGI